MLDRSDLALRSSALVAAFCLAVHPAVARAVEPEPGSPEGQTASGTELGVTSLVFNGSGGRQIRQDGVAIAWRSRTWITERTGANVSVTWGLTDWDRAREWIDAGNSSGRWTTDHIQSVTHWVEEGGDSQGLRFLGAIFADMFLAMTYAAVPFCYVGSVGGATSHLQLDVTGDVHMGGGIVDAWAEGGVGVVGLPVQFARWEYAAGPVVGLGAEVGPVRLGAKLLWSPDFLTSSARADRSVVTASLTAGARF